MVKLIDLVDKLKPKYKNIIVYANILIKKYN
jgi:hypothetical protein